ncbi:glycosyltransferase family 4 protein [Methylobacterium dankookense]|uniref:Glycogen synthase n=1 Tax=Methylobacterium dankookense TaxID=560405 RepID=A0A564G5P5_9HYPH|nr:glycosyltransferase family 4 protein [Methylobacterium dankookense]GJD59833.1 Glycogen synthase [Methylobacterium dankookense]VUF15326.1 Glycogen synthase [Methylobacterium dankookense]
MVAAFSPLDSGPPRRILHVFRAPVGGLFRHVVDLVRLQAAAGHKVGIVCDSNTGGARAEQALADLAPHLALGVRRVSMRRNPHLGDLAALRAVAARAETVRADVLHGHGAKGGVYARLAAVEAGGRPVIRAYTPHGGSYNYRPGSLLHRLYMAAEGVLARRTDVFLFESEFVASRHRAYVGVAASVTRIVHNGIGEVEFVPVARAADPFDLLYVGELREAKGLPVLLEALARLHAQGRRLRLLMVGSGPDAESLATLAAAHGLKDAVAFEPAQPIRGVLARGRILVVPSLAESLPYVVLEAAAAAMPMVSTNVGGIPEIFGEAADMLIPARDPVALQAAIAALVDEAPERVSARFRALSDSVHERFSMDRMASDVLSGYAAAFRAQRRSAEAPVPVKVSEPA